jgi:hypothetical protein
VSWQCSFSNNDLTSKHGTKHNKARLRGMSEEGGMSSRASHGVSGT